MKHIFCGLLTFFAAVTLSAATQYEFNPGRYGWINGSLNILEDVSSLTLYSNFGSIGNSGSVGYYVYTDTPANAVQGAVTFSKHDGAITLPELKAGDKVGFFLTRNNGQVIRKFNFMPYGDSYFLIFNKNGGHGHDEAMFLSSIVPESASAPSGQPLPGLLMTLLAGIAAFLIFRRRRLPARKTAV